MNYKLMLRMLGRTLQVEALCLIIPMLVALYYREDPLPFLYTILPVGILGTLLARLRSNAEFFSQRGMSLRADTPEEAAAAAWRLSQDRSLQKSMREAQREFTNPRAARDIVKRVVLA
mgnify:CR=1 FL=1